MLFCAAECWCRQPPLWRLRYVLTEGSEVEIAVANGIIEIEPVVGPEPAPLTDRDVRALLEHQREERYRRVLGADPVDDEAGTSP